MSFKERESTASAGGIFSRQGKVHGLVTFGLTTLIGFYLLTSARGQGIGGAGSFVSSVVNVAGKASRAQLPAW